MSCFSWFCLFLCGLFVVIPSWFRVVATWLKWCNLKSQGSRCPYAGVGHGNNGKIKRGSQRCQSSVSVWIACLCFLQCIRYGEAKHPGPELKVEWSIGTFNPNGLAHRADVVSDLPGDFWGVTETHLSRIGFQKFTKGLQCNKSEFRYVIPGKPCQLRARSQEAGDFTGVAALSKWPCRSLPHSIPSAIYDTSRVQVVGVCIHGIWMTVGITYGFPKSTTHMHPKFCTEQHLEAVIDRVAGQTVGPRIIMGDFNWERHELSQLDRLEDMGFVEIQSLANDWWSTPIRPTGTGTRRIDYVYISRELIGLFKGVVLDDAQWPDHSSVAAVFHCPPSAIESYHWHLPQHTKWPQDWIFDFCPSPDASPTWKYAEFWNQVEQSASHEMVVRGFSPLTKSETGRGQTLDTKRRSFCPAPLRKSRNGEIQPEYFGPSVKYSQLFKQARRLQSFVRASKSSADHQKTHLPALWRSICNAPGFRGGFCKWWHNDGHTYGNRFFQIGSDIPCADDAADLFQAVQSFVKDVEKRLIRDRVAGAKQRRATDLRYVFRDCQKDQPSKVGLLIDSKHAEVVDINYDDYAIILEPPVSFLQDEPVCHAGKPLEIIHSEPDCLWVNDVSCINIGDSIRQTKVLSDVSSIFDAFRQEWEPRWKRATQILPSQWMQISNFAQQSLPRTEWCFRDWDLSQFRVAMKSKKKTAATGPDGISRADLMSFPDTVLEGITSLYQDIETSHQWPAQMTIGIVSSLEKTPGALHTSEYRPIVVYSLLYRIWASRRARDFLRSFVAIAPDGVRGGIPSRQAKSIWYEAAFLLEQANVDASSCIGVVADLSKAFNTIPREPIWVALAAMGVPRWFIKTWASFVACQSRRFKVRQSVGPPIYSDVGYPEGCALSVCAMAIIDFLLDCWLRPIHPSVQIMSYVDDWQIIHRILDQHAQIVQSLWDFVDAVAMKVDKRKSFVWATLARERKILRETSNLQVVLCAKELGAHLNFCRKPGNRTLLDRIFSMGHTWQLLRQSLCSYSQKVIALRMLAWPRSLYGISVVRVGPLNFGTLRTGALRGLKQDRIGSNPCLHLPLNGYSVDPEGFAILQTIKDARDFADVDAFRAMLSLYHAEPSQFPQNGPVTILSQRLLRLGWELQADGTFLDSLGVFDIFLTHIDDIQFRIALAWGWILTAEVSHRKDFAGIQAVDLSTTRAILQEFFVSDQIYLRCSLDGTLVTQKDRKHFEEGNEGLCEFCGCPDSLKHRVWQCPAFQKQRDDFPSKFLPKIEDLPECTVQHAWAFRPKSYDLVANSLEALCDQSPSAYRVPCLMHDTLDLFCDGTCKYPKAKPLRYAAWAVTMAHPFGNGYDNDLVAAGLVPGQHQSAYRAELLGFKHALALATATTAKCVRVWCDCQSVITTAVRFQRHLLRLKPNSSHWDLWHQVVDLIHQLGPRLQICQVFSHNQISSGLTEIEAWAYWHNSLTDIAADKMNVTRPDGFWKCWNEAFLDYSFYSELFSEIAKLHVRVGKKADEMSKVVKNSQRKVDTPDPAKAVVQPRRYIVAPKLVDKHGYNIVQTVFDWWVATGSKFLTKAGPMHWISFTQLFLDFQLATGHCGPTYRDLVWHDDDSIFEGTTLPDWGQRARWFQLLLKGFWKENHVAVEIKSGPPFSAMVQCWMVNVRIPWCKDRLDMVDECILKSVGVLRRGKKIRALPRFHLDESMAVPLTNGG